MPRFPYFSFPNPYYRNYNYYHNYNKTNIKSYNNTQERQPINQENFRQDILSEKQKAENRYNSEKAFLDLFGIKLYFDDILLISLIFFLYNEGVKDEGLFFALVLLLLT